MNKSLTQLAHDTSRLVDQYRKTMPEITHLTMSAVDYDRVKGVITGKANPFISGFRMNSDKLYYDNMLIVKRKY